MKVLKVFLVMVFLGTTMSLFSQKNVKIEKSSYLNKNENSFLDNVPIALLEISTKISSSGAIDLKPTRYTTEQEILSALGLEKEFTFKFRDEIPSKLIQSGKYKRYQQYYNGVRIEGAGFSAKYENNSLTYFKPQIIQNLNLSSTPSIKEYQLDVILQPQSMISKELLISSKFHGIDKYVWKVNYMKNGNNISYIDAVTGEILSTKSGLIHKNAPTEDFGTRNMNDTNIGNITSLISGDGVVRTYNMNLLNLYEINTATDFTSNLIPTSNISDDWTITDAPENVFQAHWCVSRSVEEFAQLGINFGHLNVGANCDNVYSGNQSPNAVAFQISTLANAYIAFGHNGSNTLAHNDVIGHELGHVYLFDFLDAHLPSSGSLHEGIADMFGVYNESQLQSLDWIMGDDIPMDVRNLRRPDYDCFDEVINFTEPHLRGSPLGHWFFRLTVGDHANGITAIPMLSTLNIILDALPYMPEDADYPEMREATLTATSQAFGFCSSEYKSISAAWDFICVEGNVEVCTCDSEGNDEEITADTPMNGDIEINGNIIVNSNATLSIHLANISFFQNKGIIVKNGGRLILQGSHINACDPSQSWSGIKIESGGFFDTDESFLINAANGIDAQANSTLQINKLSLEGKGNNTGIGLKMEGNVNTEFIYYLNINKFNTGIQSYNCNNVHEFNHGFINNTKYGVRSINSPIIVNDYNIDFTDEAISIMASPYSFIFDSDIIFRDQGINITLSPNTVVENCSVSNSNLLAGIENLNERPAVGIFLSDNCEIKNNHPIASASNAVSVWGSNNATIYNNYINSNFNNSGQLVGGPVNLQFGNNHTVTQNYISADQSEFGINSNWAEGTTIMNNTVYNSGFQKNFRTAGIKATGNLNELINQNIVTGIDRTGVLVQNTTGNQYFCNEINSIYNEAQDILYNSEQQTIKANTFDGGEFDMKIKSEIGLQATTNSSGFVIENNGNVFNGGNTVAEGLSSDQLFNSRFPVNPFFFNHMASNPIPSSGWFIQNNVKAYANCDGLIIGDNFIFGNDPNKICAYWSYLKSIRTSKPEIFFVKLIHLLKYSKTKAGFILPNCLKLDPVFQSLCGITMIVDVSVALTKIRKNSTSSSGLQSLQTQYKNETNDEGRTYIKNNMTKEMASLLPQHEYERFADSLRLDSLKTKINSINCTSIIVSKWKEILKIYINFIKQGKVQNADKSGLESYATDCSDLNGEAIHLARSMANTYNRTYYDVYDGCMQEAEPRLTSPQNNEEITVSPNPTTGKLNINYSEKFNGSINLYNLSGQKILSQLVIGNNINNIDISNEQTGLYFMQIVSENGINHEFKIILIK